MINESDDEDDNSISSKRSLTVHKKPVIQKPYARKSTAARTVPLARRSSTPLNNCNGENKHNTSQIIQRQQSIDQNEFDEQTITSSMNIE